MLFHLKPSHTEAFLMRFNFIARLINELKTTCTEVQPSISCVWLTLTLNIHHEGSDVGVVSVVVGNRTSLASCSCPHSHVLGSYVMLSTGNKIGFRQMKRVDPRFTVCLLRRFGQKGYSCDPRVALGYGRNLHCAELQKLHHIWTWKSFNFLLKPFSDSL